VALQRCPHLNWIVRNMTESREQSTADLRSARYDIITAGENWAAVVTGGVAAGPYRLTQERGSSPYLHR
jgi:hypothetical protein